MKTPLQEALGYTAVSAIALFVDLSVALVFNYRRFKNQPLELASAAIGVAGLAINAAAMFFGVRYLRVHYLAAKCGAAGLTFAWNFSVRRHLLFVRRRAT